MTSIPEPLPYPVDPSDVGAGEWGSQPIYSRGDDILYAKAAAAVSIAAEAGGLTHAARHLNHYLDNSGSTLDPNVDELLRDVTNMDMLAKRLVGDEVRRTAAAAIVDKTFAVPQPFRSPWPPDIYITPDLSEDWFFAMGAIQICATGIVTVSEPAHGAEPLVSVEYKVWIHDRYNWDEGKQTKIAGITVKDKDMGELHTAGLAREYDLDGGSSIRRYKGPVPATGPIDLPGADDNRDGQRSDPTR